LDDPAILVNGVALDLNGIEYRVTVSHGRNDITAPPQPSDASMTLLGFTSIPVAISDVVDIEAYGEARFTGRVTDTSLTHDFNPNGPTVGAPVTSYVARLDVTMIGNLSRLGLAFVGAGGYAKELLNDRVENILTDAGLSYANNSDPLMTQEALPALDGGYSALDLLTALGTETGGTLCDLPDGAVLWESYSRRGFGYNPATWLDIDVLDTWADINTIWADVYDRVDTAPATIELPAHAVTWSPVWRNTSQTILNDVTVVYGVNGNQSETDTDPASIITHRPPSIHAHDAAPRGDRRAGPGVGHHPHPVSSLGIQCSPSRCSWRKLPTLFCAQLLQVISGGKIDLDDTPQPSPIEDYIGIVEGWSETYTPGQHRLVLSLSDPRFSYQVVKWSEVDPALLWSGVDLSVQWYNVVITGRLVA
jgi:hypothetical protein